MWVQYAQGTPVLTITSLYAYDLVHKKEDAGIGNLKYPPFCTEWYYE